MISFVRRTLSVLDRPARIRFLAFAVMSLLVAVIEAAGVGAIVPLTRLLVGEEGADGAVEMVQHFVPVESTREAALVLAVVVVIAFTIKAVAAISLLRWALGNSLRQEARIARRLFDSYLRAPAEYHFAHNSAEIQRTLNESLLIVFRQGLPAVLAASADVFTLVALAIVIGVSDPSVAALAVTYFALVAVIYQRFIGGRQRVAARRAHKEMAVRYQQVQEPMQSAKELSILHREGYFVDVFYRTKLQLADAQRQLMFYQQLPRQFLDVAFVLGAALMAGILFSTRPVAGALVAIGLFLTASIRLVSPLNRIMTAATVSRTAGPSIAQVITDLRALKTTDDRPSETDVQPLEPAPVELRDVHYRYGPDLPEVLEGISLQIMPGDDIAIVGSTGAGKSTLLDVLLGVLTPESGDVLIGGRAVETCRTAWQLSIGYVPQQVLLIDDTVRANVAFGVDPATVDDSLVWEALRQAQIDGFVSGLSESLSSPVGEMGVRLSGGQRQRIGLARALYHRPAVLVLDEATSSLDAHTEALVMDTIAQLRGTMTIITVSHRLSTLKHCDRVYFLRGGKVGSVGSFDHLKENEPEFARLLHLAAVAPSVNG